MLEFLWVVFVHLETEAAAPPRALELIPQVGGSSISDVLSLPPLHGQALTSSLGFTIFYNDILHSNTNR